MSSTCNRCGLEITWKKPFTQGDRPLNMDNSVHSCKNSYENEEPATINNIVKSPVNTPKIDISEIIDEINLLKKEFGELECAKFESIMKYAISRTMGIRR